jgi:oxaloacetate decarboxylase beta subunit
MKIFLLTLLCFFSGALASGFAGDAASGDRNIEITSPADAKVFRVDVEPGSFVYSGDQIATLKKADGTVIILKAGVSGKILTLNTESYKMVKEGDIIGTLQSAAIVADQPPTGTGDKLPALGQLFKNLFQTTGIYDVFKNQVEKDWTVGLGRVLMITVGLIVLYLGIFKGFEPLLLIPIGYGAILSNIPLAGIAEPGGILYYIYAAGITTGVFPLLIFMGVGALTDFGPMLANPVTILLGAAAQLGIFATLLGALFLSQYVPGINFSLRDLSLIHI